MKINRITRGHQITAISGEVTYLWNKMGQLKIYPTKVDMYREQLRLARTHFNSYIRNSKGMKDAAKSVQELEDLIGYESRNSHLSS